MRLRGHGVGLALSGLGFQGGDAPFGSGAPLDELDEPGLGLGLLTGLAGLALTEYRGEPDTVVSELSID